MIFESMWPLRLWLTGHAEATVADTHFHGCSQ
jgi:hypothetical protein